MQKENPMRGRVGILVNPIGHIPARRRKSLIFQIKHIIISYYLSTKS
jgi:hypothetical protein